MPVQAIDALAPKKGAPSRIAIALEYPVMQQGGTEVLVRELIRRLSRRFELILVSGDPSGEDLPAEFQQLIQKHFCWKRDQGGRGQGEQLARELFAQGIDLAHFHFGGTYEWRANRIGHSPAYHLPDYGIPCLSTNHLVMEWLNCGVHPNRSLGYKWMAQLYAWVGRAQLYRKLKTEICVSRHDQSRLRGMFPMFAGKMGQLYHSLLPATAPHPNLHNRSAVILCIGTIGGRKAQPNLVEAFARVAQKHPQWQLQIIGRVGVEHDLTRIQDCIAQQGLAARVQLPGCLSDEELLQRMLTSSIVAMPSLQEGLGLSLQEALFYGCVGVGSRAGGIPELIEHEVNGLLVPPGDVTALSEALDRLMSDPQLLEKLRARSRPSILSKGMTAEAMTENYLKLYESLGG